jgi:hypothetical protein
MYHDRDFDHECTVNVLCSVLGCKKPTESNGNVPEKTKFESILRVFLHVMIIVCRVL